MKITTARPIFRLGFGALALVVAAACGGSTPSDQTADGGEVIDCSKDARVTAYKPGLTTTSTSGALSFVLVKSDPGPPTRGTDTWTIKVSNASTQAPMTGLSMTVLPFMPDHGHGTAVNATVTANADGTYTVAPLYFFMPGVWRITFTSTAPADTAQFLFCIPG